MAPTGVLESTTLGLAMRQSTWLYPAVETVHIIGLALLVGSIAVLDLRLMGFSRGLPVRKLAGHTLPWTLGSFFLILPSGLMMFAAHATDLIASPVFALKMGLVFAAVTNAAVFHATIFRSAVAWDVEVMPPIAARASALLSLLLWFTVIACGRLLAYT
ncbi:MAG: DUF6644 family protein [Betaproteobacteria bacterium]